MPAVENGARPLSVELAIRSGLLTAEQAAKLIEKVTVGYSRLTGPETMQAFVPNTTDPKNVTTVSFVDVLEGKVDPKILEGALVVVGMADGTNDMHTSPKSGEKIPGVYFHAFALHSFADEMAHAAKRDPLEFLLDLLGPGKVVDLKAQGVDYSNYGAPIDKYPVDTRRLRRVLEVAAERSGWAKRKSGNGAGMGIAAHRSFNTYVASVVQVEVDRQGRVKIPRIHQVADPGVVINPDRVRAQFEGAAVMGVGLAMFGEITATNGRIDQKNFDGFRVARMNDAPVQVDVHFVESGNLPTGVGEPGVPPVIAALANAIYAATGKRLREMPFSKQKLV